MAPVPIPSHNRMLVTRRVTGLAVPGLLHGQDRAARLVQRLMAAPIRASRAGSPGTTELPALRRAAQPAPTGDTPSVRPWARLDMPLPGDSTPAVPSIPFSAPPTAEPQVSELLEPETTAPETGITPGKPAQPAGTSSTLQEMLLRRLVEIQSGRKELGPPPDAENPSAPLPMPSTNEPRPLQREAIQQPIQPAYPVPRPGRRAWKEEFKSPTSETPAAQSPAEEEPASSQPGVSSLPGTPPAAPGNSTLPSETAVVRRQVSSTVQPSLPDQASSAPQPERPAHPTVSTSPVAPAQPAAGSQPAAESQPRVFQPPSPEIPISRPLSQAQVALNQVMQRRLAEIQRERAARAESSPAPEPPPTPAETPHPVPPAPVPGQARPRRAWKEELPSSRPATPASAEKPQASMPPRVEPPVQRAIETSAPPAQPTSTAEAPSPAPLLAETEENETAPDQAALAQAVSAQAAPPLANTSQAVSAQDETAQDEIAQDETASPKPLLTSTTTVEAASLDTPPLRQPALQTAPEPPSGQAPTHAPAQETLEVLAQRSPAGPPPITPAPAAQSRPVETPPAPGPAPSARTQSLPAAQAAPVGEPQISGAEPRGSLSSPPIPASAPVSPPANLQRSSQPQEQPESSEFPTEPDLANAPAVQQPSSASDSAAPKTVPAPPGELAEPAAPPDTQPPADRQSFSAERLQRQPARSDVPSSLAQSLAQTTQAKAAPLENANLPTQKETAHQAPEPPVPTEPAAGHIDTIHRLTTPLPERTTPLPDVQVPGDRLSADQPASIELAAPIQPSAEQESPPPVPRAPSHSEAGATALPSIESPTPDSGESTVQRSAAQPEASRPVSAQPATTPPARADTPPAGEVPPSSPPAADFPAVEPLTSERPVTGTITTDTLDPHNLVRRQSPAQSEPQTPVRPEAKPAQPGTLPTPPVQQAAQTPTQGIASQPASLPSAPSLPASLPPASLKPVASTPISSPPDVPTDLPSSLQTPSSQALPLQRTSDRPMPPASFEPARPAINAPASPTRSAPAIQAAPVQPGPAGLTAFHPVLRKENLVIRRTPQAPITPATPSQPLPSSDRPAPTRPAASPDRLEAPLPDPFSDTPVQQRTASQATAPAEKEAGQPAAASLLVALAPEVQRILDPNLFPTSAKAQSRPGPASPPVPSLPSSSEVIRREENEAVPNMQSSTTAEQPAQQQPVDLQNLARQVLPILKRLLAIESERQRGRRL